MDNKLLLNSQIKKPDCFFILFIRPDSIPKTQTNRIFSLSMYTTLYTHTHTHMHGFEINKHNQSSETVRPEYSVYALMTK